MGKRKNLRDLAIACVGLAIVGRLSAPDFLGFSVLPLAVAALLATLAGPRPWREAFAALTAPGGRAVARTFLFAALSLTALLALGDVHFLPVVNVGAGRVGLAPETLALLKKLDRPATITVALGPQAGQIAMAKELAAQYGANSRGQLTFTFITPQTMPDGLDLRGYNTAQVSAENFSETLSQFSEQGLNTALIHLLSPQRRLIYFLNTFGEKMIADNGPYGLSRWAENLMARRVMAQDYHWPDGAPIPPEAAAVVLAGPKAPLGEPREAALFTYLKNGGRAMILVDPLVTAISADFWKKFGLEFKEGLTIDPEGNLAGTAESFVVASDYPAHPITEALGHRPSLWPLAGAFFALPYKPALAKDSYSIAQSSSSAWLESDPVSLADGSYRYEKQHDAAGPLALATATALDGGGRLVTLADSDVAANNFSGFSGNRAFVSAAANWLLDGDAALPPSPERAQELILTRISAPLFFWLPVVAWPLFILALWALISRRKRGR